MTDQKFRALVEQYEKLVYTICFQFTRDRQIAEDLTQETFLSAYTHIDSYSDATAKPWFARIATNKAKDYLKSAYHNRVEASGSASELPEPLPVSTPLRTVPIPEEIYIEREQVAAIEALIRGLKEPYRQVSIQFFLEEKTVQEIAQETGRPYKTVHTQLYRAKNLLQEQILKGGKHSEFI